MAETTSITRNASLVGWLNGDDLLVEGRLEGNLTATGRAHLGPTSTVRACVDADVTQIDGEFEGEVRTRLLRIGPTGRASGRFRFESLVVADGATIEGAFNEEAAVAEPASEASPIETREDAGAQTESLASEPVPAGPAPAAEQAELTVS
ncbi:MAG: polymer-forming cytoskeletal protein [Vicinamibacteria bacterium]